MRILTFISISMLLLLVIACNSQAPLKEQPVVPQQVPEEIVVEEPVVVPAPRGLDDRSALRIMIQTDSSATISSYTTTLTQVRLYDEQLRNSTLFQGFRKAEVVSNGNTTLLALQVVPGTYSGARVYFSQDRVRLTSGVSYPYSMRTQLLDIPHAFTVEKGKTTTLVLLISPDSVFTNTSNSKWAIDIRSVESEVRVEDGYILT